MNIDFSPNLGYLGKDKRIVYSVGCMGHGVSMTHLNGWTIADLILERQTERTAGFFVNRSYSPFPDEPLRGVGANGGLELMRAEAGPPRTSKRSLTVLADISSPFTERTSFCPARR